ncbi:tetratricopeptide repeat protein [Parvularcula sp. ZS-1/3]|uniref:Tetratricopeptide repeat protein n=1 Tax=Parvularcula mediterranea TaxID=2732508 RepID=A0A7Y3W6B6_9PROT|nr:tetratricopeptide repeat protein [Parvularcula mediterranea]NNU17363.1 tetratricopeptide repeat protein [Parvularcula mediterranea]
MASPRENPAPRLGRWRPDLASSRLIGPDGEERRLEPKVADLLGALLDANGATLSREDLFSAVWPGVTVGEDTLSRAVSKLRKALDDDPKASSLVITVPKRGYRLVASEAAPTPRARWLWPSAALASLLLLAGVAINATNRPAPEPSPTVERATDRYMEFTRAGNEAAIELYARALRETGSDPKAEAGMAAALVQRVIRWPEAVGLDEDGATSLEAALAAGLTDSAEAKAVLAQARSLAEKSVRQDPRNSDALRILGLVRTAQRDLDGAFEAYEKALDAEPGNWAVLINLSEIQAMRGNKAESYRTLTKAYNAIGNASGPEAQRAAPWRAPLGVLLAERDLDAGRNEAAESWYKRVLEDDPFDRGATEGLASLLLRSGRASEARALCAAYTERTGDSLPCSP